MEKPTAVATCINKSPLHGRWIVSFKTGEQGSIGSIVLQLTDELARYFEVGASYVISFEKVMHSNGPT